MYVKVKKGKRIIYICVECNHQNGTLTGFQVYKNDLEPVYTKWSSKVWHTFRESEIIEEIS